MISEDLRHSGRKVKIIRSWKTVQQMDLWAIQHDSSDELLCRDMLFGTVPIGYID